MLTLLIPVKFRIRNSESPMSKESYIIPIFQIRKLRLKEVTQRTLTYWLCLLWTSHEGPWDGPAPPPGLPNAYF